MAIKQRVLMRLDVLESHMHNAMKEKGRTALRDAYNVLVELRDMYKEGLPASNYPVYGEIYDGLMVAVQQLIVDKDIDSQEDVYFLCNELLQYIKKETEQEKHFKKEIVFLPYQAAMWDSLESVWKAAYEDKDHCNAYVIPIPYCERNPDTSAAVWHCDREKFPKYVPTMDWKRIDLKAWHPDVIFFHNPFDDHNAVTSVDSAYYSRNLRNCTDKLVYIPYAVEEEIQPGNEAAETAIEHRVLLPGFVNADLIIAQSEDMRQAWINILMRNTSAKDRAYWEKRILGLGSPKIDKVLTSQKEDFEMPKKWRKSVKGKKVILYVTSISPMLQNSDKVCDKLRYVFDIFRNRKDVVLWWRPHPLMKATFHSMRPQFEEEYLQLEKQYIEEGWGIYDDSSDLHRAICWSDAYYGDWSSVIILYRETRKPVMVQDFSLDSNKKLYFYNLAMDAFDGYTLDYFRGSLYQVDFRNKQVTFLAQIPKEFLTEGVPYGDFSLVCQNGDRLMLLPAHSNHVLEYDLKEKTFFNVFDVHHGYLGGNEGTFFQMMSYGDCRYFLGYRCSRILKYDVVTRKYSYLDEWFLLLKQYIEKTDYNCEDGGKSDILGCACKKDNSLFLPTPQANVIIEIDLSTNETRLHAVGNRSNRYYAIDFDGTDYWILSWNEAKVIQWRYGTGEVNEFQMSDMKNEYKGIPYYSSIRCSEDHVYLYPGSLERLTVLNKKTKKKKHISTTAKYFCGTLTDGRKVYVTDELEKGYVSFTFYDNNIFEEICLSRKGFTNMFSSFCNFRRGWTAENFYISLHDYCKNIHSESFIRSVSDTDQSLMKCGENIYQEVSR